MIQDTIESTQATMKNGTALMVITVIAVLILLGWEFFTKIFPPIRDALRKRFKQEEKEKHQQEALNELEAYRKETEQQREETRDALQSMEREVGKLHAQMDYLMASNQLLLEGMLDILMCMEGSKDQAECARNAIGRINAFLVKNNGPLQ